MAVFKSIDEANLGGFGEEVRDPTNRCKRATTTLFDAHLFLYNCGPPTLSCIRWAPHEGAPRTRCLYRSTVSLCPHAKLARGFGTCVVVWARFLFRLAPRAMHGRVEVLRYHVVPDTLEVAHELAEGRVLCCKAGPCQSAPASTSQHQPAPVSTKPRRLDGGVRPRHKQRGRCATEPGRAWHDPKV